MATKTSKTKSAVAKLAASKLAVQKLNRKIAKDNKDFAALKPAEKRVAIARDVLAQLQSKRLVPKSGKWLTAKDDNPLFSKKALQKDSELQEVLLKTKVCEGCAIGGMFMCAVEKADKLKLSELTESEECDDYDGDIGAISETDAFNYLNKFFSNEQLLLIESAFEMGEGVGSDSEAYSFAEEANSYSECMRLIMENIIVNKGKFDPSKKPVVVLQTPGFVLQTPGFVG